MAKPFLRIKPGGRNGRRRPSNAELRSNFKHGLPNATMRKKPCTQISFKDVPRENWEKAFGTFDPNKFRRALAEQKRRKAEGLEDVGARPALVGIFGDNKGAGRRMYKAGTFDWGLGERINGRSDANRKARAKGLRRVG